MVREAELSKSLKQSSMSDIVKHLGEVEWQDNDTGILNYAGDAGDTGDLVIGSAAYSIDNRSMGEGANLLQTRR